MRTTFACAILTVFLHSASMSHAAPPDGILKQTDADHGLCIHLGTSDGKLELSLAKSPRRLVQGLTLDDNALSQARKTIEAEDAYGRVSIVKVSTLQQLPYANNLVTLLITDADALKKSACPEREIVRVLAPRGIALIHRDGKWQRIVKPIPKETDEWTHQWHGPDGNLLSQDKVVGVPQGIQWLAGPMFPQDGRKSSTHSFVSAGGRVFSVTQNELGNLRQENGKKPPNFLIARDAHNGLFLWKRLWEGPIAKGSGATSARMVAIGDRLYIVEKAGISALDGATGKKLLSFESKEPAQQISISGGVLLAEHHNALTAFDVKTGKQKWTHTVAQPFGTVLGEKHVYYLAGKRSSDGRKINELITLDLNSGKVQWRHVLDYSLPWANSNTLRICFVTKDFLGLMDQGRFKTLAVSDGKVLWDRTTKQSPGKSYVDKRFVGHFYIHGLVWHRISSATWEGLDPKTGSVRRTLKGSGSWPRTETPGKMGCQPLFATPNFILVPRQATLLEFDNPKRKSFKFMRGGCGLGAVPANGLMYSFPHACGCYHEVLRGFVALTSRSRDEEKDATPDFVQGNAFGFKLQKVNASEEDWPTYRADKLRSAYVKTELPEQPKLLWSRQITDAKPARTQEEWELRTGRPVTAPVIVGNRVYVGDPETHRLLALDVKTGKEIWRFTLNGRMSTPPTIYRGLCMTGCHDGWVYCLSADEGKLIWKFRAAPNSRQIVAYGQVESVWPVTGGVLMQDGLAFVAAGRAPDGDGGVWIHALQPETGKVLWSKNVRDGRSGACDVLVSNGAALYLLGKEIDPKTGETGKPSDLSSFLRSGKSGLLDAFWTRQVLALRKNIQTWAYGGRTGQVIAFSPDRICTSDTNQGVRGKGKNEWSSKLPSSAQVEALAMSRETLVMGGPTNRSARKAGGSLWCLTSESGKRTATLKLKAPPVHDGLAIARGMIFVSTEDGRISCYGR